MPDKQNDKGFMAMLERKGIVRKSGAEEEPADMSPADAQPRNEADLRSLLNQPDGDAMKVTPAARQPVPGFSTPILPGDKTDQDTRGTNTAPVGTAVPIRQDTQTGRMEREGGASSAAPGSGSSNQDGGSAKDGAMRPAASPKSGTSPESFEALKQVGSPGQGWGTSGNITGIDPFKEINTTGDKPAAGPVAQPAQATQPPQAPRPPQPQQTPLERAPEKPAVDSYTDRYLDIEELYEVLSLKTKRTDTVYLIEEYLKALPDSLPDQSRREIVGNIVAASGFDYDLLMGDGVLRVKTLKDYAERFARYTDDYIAARNAELNELEQQSMRIRRLIENRKDLHKQQFFVIEAEAQRLKEILTFISG